MTEPQHVALLQTHQCRCLRSLKAPLSVTQQQQPQQHPGIQASVVDDTRPPSSGQTRSLVDTTSTFCVVRWRHAALMKRFSLSRTSRLFQRPRQDSAQATRRAHGRPAARGGFSSEIFNFLPPSRTARLSRRSVLPDAAAAESESLPARRIARIHQTSPVNADRL